MKKFKRCFAFAGLVFVCVVCAGGTVYAAAELAKISLYHKHSDACTGYVEVETEADLEQRTNLIYMDTCPYCGGELHHYRFYAECSCGESWEEYGYACQNSIYGENKAGGCLNYSKVESDTLHTHLLETYFCGKDENTLIGEIVIEASDTEPVHSLTLTARYSGEIAEPEYEWRYEGETEVEKETEGTEGNEGEGDAGTVNEAGNEEEIAKEDETESTEGTETAGETGTEEETGGSEKPGEKPAEEEKRPQKSSSISVKKNGIYTLTAEYEENGINYLAQKSITISNIIPEEPEPPKETPKSTEPSRPKKVSPASFEGEIPLPVPANPGNDSVETEEKDDEETQEESSETFVIRPLFLEEMVEDVLTDEGTEKDIHETEATSEEEKDLSGNFPLGQVGRYFYTTWRKMPVEEKIVTVTVGGLIGGVMVSFANLIFGKTASVYWIDEKKRKHFLERAGIKKGVGKYEIHIRKEALRFAKTADICVRMPGIFTLLHKYHPVGVFCEGSMYSLHVERDIYITAG